MDNILKPVLIAVIIILAVLIIWKANRFTTAQERLFRHSLIGIIETKETKNCRFGWKAVERREILNG